MYATYVFGMTVHAKCLWDLVHNFGAVYGVVSRTRLCHLPTHILEQVFCKALLRHVGCHRVIDESSKL